MRTAWSTVTGYGWAGDRERTKAAGFEAHLTEPVALAKLQRFIDGAEP